MIYIGEENEFEMNCATFFCFQSIYFVQFPERRIIFMAQPVGVSRTLVKHNQLFLFATSSHPILHS